MAMKRFVAPDMRRALDMVRQHLGPDAIILSSKRTNKGVEVITSTELDYPTRGATQAREFRQKFDEELDGPLASDSAWQVQSGVETAVNHYRAQAAPKFDHGRSEQLAAEIEAARERMLAAQRGERVSKRSEAASMPTHSYHREAEQFSPSSATQPEAAQPSAVQPNAVQAFQQQGIQSAPPQAGPHSAEPMQVTSGQASSFQGAESRPVSPPPESQQSKTLESASATDNLAGVDRQMAGLREQVAKMEVAQKQSSHDASNMNALRDEIADMRMLLEQQMWRMKDGLADPFSGASPLLESLKNHLSALGLPSELVKKLSTTIKPGQRLNAAWRSALAHLTKHIDTDNSDPVNQGGIFAFVGPTGVGKTTTIAKLAARYVLKHGMGKVALITTDTFRVGAHDQLRSLGRILNVPVRVVDKERALPAVISSLKDYPLILIDTAGFRQGDPLLRDQEQLLASCPGLQRILVLASNSQRQTLKASAHAFKSGKLRGCIITKIDETGSLGEMLGVLSQQRIPVLYSADGQNIPNDLSVASASSLVAKAVNLMKLQREAEKTLAASV